MYSTLIRLCAKRKILTFCNKGDKHKPKKWQSENDKTKFNLIPPQRFQHMHNIRFQKI